MVKVPVTCACQRLSAEIPCAEVERLDKMKVALQADGEEGSKPIVRLLQRSKSSEKYQWLAFNDTDVHLFSIKLLQFAYDYQKIISYWWFAMLVCQCQRGISSTIDWWIVFIDFQERIFWRTSFPNEASLFALCDILLNSLPVIFLLRSESQLSLCWLFFPTFFFFLQWNVGQLQKLWIVSRTKKGNSWDYRLQKMKCQD